MNVYDLEQLETYPYDQRDKNVFHQEREFKTRIIRFEPGGSMPECTMAYHVIFLVLEGTVRVRVNEQQAVLQDGQCLITEPATLSMQTDTGVRLLGVQIAQA